MLDLNHLMEGNSLMSVILDQKSEQKRLVFANADGKIWIMPRKNMRTAMHLYQPSSRKGKLVKILFPYLNRIKYIQNKVGARSITVDLEKDLKQKLKDIFASKKIEFAVFGGTPSKHQKITIQLSHGNNILGYCKISDNSEVKRIFEHEKDILNNLRNNQLKNNIPICLYCGKFKEDINIFVQSTLKTNQSSVYHRWGKIHWIFLSEFRCKTRKRLNFEQTDYYSTLNRIINSPDFLIENENRIVKETAQSIMALYAEKEVLFSAYHGDLTPWNTFIENEDLFVFDFEYAQMTYPPHLDWFHFFTQTAIFEKHWDAKKIYNEYLLIRDDIKSRIDSPNLYYKCYLLDIIARITNRDKGQYDKDTSRCISIWIDLLTHL